MGKDKTVTLEEETRDSKCMEFLSICPNKITAYLVTLLKAENLQ